MSVIPNSDASGPELIGIHYSGGKVSGESNNDSMLSIGGYMSTLEIPDNLLQNIFGQVTQYDILNGLIEYRCIFLKNNNPNSHAGDLKLYIEGLNNIKENIEFGISIPLNGDSINPVQLLANRHIAPSGIVFYSAIDLENSIDVGGIEMGGKVIAIWLKRIIPKQVLINEVRNIKLKMNFTWTDNLDASGG